MANNSHQFLDSNKDRHGRFRCDKCCLRCNTIVDLAIHQAEHLFISVPFTEICPLCTTEIQNLEHLLHHVLQHMIEDQLEQAKLIIWMSLQNYGTHHFISKRLEHVVPQIYKDFKIIKPAIELHNKCMFCCKFFSPDPKATKRVLKHVFSQHLLSSSSPQTIERAALWAVKFFELEESKSIVKKFHDFLLESKTLDRSSHLLEELDLFENQATNTCRYCQMKFSDASTLYSHYVVWHNEQPSKYYNCSICNFKQSDEVMFMDHIYKRHMRCPCGEKFYLFEKRLKHVRDCLKNCPYCKNKFDMNGLVSHLTKGKEVGFCPFCQQEMKSDQLKIHLSNNCSSKAAIGVKCPTCMKFSFVEKEEFDYHVLYTCKPWILNSNEKLPCLNGSKKKSQLRIPRGNNLVKFDDIRIFLPDKLTERIEDYFS